MFVDSQLLFSDEQNLAAITTSGASTNLVDLGAVRDIGTGEALYLVLNVDLALTDTGSNSTVTVDIQTDDNASFSSNTTAQVAFTIAATAAAGTVYYERLAPGAINERYMRLFYTMNNGDVSAGKVTAAIVKDIQKYVSYADAITIS